MRLVRRNSRPVLFIIGFLMYYAFPADAQGDTIINRYRDYLLRVDTSNEVSVETWRTTLQVNGRWPDIKYDDVEPAAWKIPDHLKRVQAMATLLISPHSKFYNDRVLLETINHALDYWIEKRYRSSNWWHNEIGVPRYMRDIIILLRDHLDAARLEKALEVLAQLRVHENYVAGNLIWCADLGLHYGALTGDEKLMQRCRDLIVREIKIGTGEGIQPDYSFQQHGRRLQMFQYGKAYIWEGLRVAWQLRGTPLSFPEDKVELLTDVLLNGWQWLARGIYTVPGTMDRSASRKGELKAADIRPLLPFVMELHPAKAAELQKMYAVQDQKQVLQGFRYFPFSDFMVYHRPGFSFFLKTLSVRTLATESINRENLKGKLLNSGDAHLISSGNEYTDLMPVWNWSLLPGVTAFEGAHAIERKAFVGSVGDGENGVTAMDYMMKDSLGKQAFSARKLWACYDDKVICLIAGMKSEHIPGGGFTALDQCRLMGPVVTSLEKGPLPKGSHQLNNLKWIYHNGFAYIPLTASDVNLRSGAVTGNWHSINNAESAQPVTEKVFMPVLLHDPAHQSSTGYVLARSASAAGARRLAKRPTWKIIANDHNVQAVQMNDGVIMAAFYEAGDIRWNKQQALHVDQPCIVLLKKGRLYMSDPLHKGVNVTIKTHRQAKTVLLPKDGTTIAVDGVF
ncbi:MAG: polysaccharide lyase family 8 super-sandwich domain-containing protein [Niabella sp.]